MHDLKHIDRGALDLVLNEMVAQRVKWGVQNHDPFAWLAILGEEFGEASKAALEFKSAAERVESGHEITQEMWDTKDHLVEELVQVAAVACSFVDCLLRAEWAWGKNTLGDQ